MKYLENIYIIKRKVIAEDRKIMANKASSL